MTRRKTATSGAGRYGGRAVHAELSASGGACCGGLWDREKQCEPTIHSREQQGRKSHPLRVSGLRIGQFDSVAELAELAAHSRGACLAGLFGDGWAPFLVSN